MRNLPIKSLLVLALGACLLAPQTGARADQEKALEDPARQVHWAMGAVFGTGWYRVDKNRSMYVFRVPPRQTLRESAPGEDGERTVGIQLQYPLTFGVHQLDDVPNLIKLDNFATASFTPGVQLEIPVTPDWYVKPYLNAGWGFETSTSDSAWIYDAGILSKYRLGRGRIDWSLLNGINYAGFKPEVDDQGQFGSVMTGLEFSHPLESARANGEDLFLNWHATYNFFFDRINFHYDDDRVESIRDQWELGLALGKGDKRFRVWFISLEQIGLSYKWSSNYRYRAITLNFQSPFNR